MVKTTNLKNSNETKQKIINAAINLFAKKDFSSVSTREIASKAGVNLSLIAYYFKTKDGLYSSIVESVTDYGIEYLEEELSLADNVFKFSLDEKKDLFLKLLNKYIDFVYSDKVPDNFIMLMVKEQTFSTSKYGKLYQEKSQIFYNTLKKILASISARTITDSTIILETCALMGQILSFKLMRQPAFQTAKNKSYSLEDIQKIKHILNLQILSLIERIKLK